MHALHATSVVDAQIRGFKYWKNLHVITIVIGTVFVLHSLVRRGCTKNPNAKRSENIQRLLNHTASMC